MTSEPAEVPLPGGRLTHGVVRVGHTVRRPASPASTFVHQLLNHLHRKGFTGCPEHLGWDDNGREMLSFLPGTVPPRWRRFADEQVQAAARLLRQMHDATRDLAADIGGEASGEVICHHDPGPNNTVFHADEPFAFIDFDFASPGHPLEDLGYMAWSWCISSRPDRGPATEQARQVRLVADAYGLSATERLHLPAAIQARLRRNEQFWRTRLNGPRRTPLPGAPTVEDVLAWTRREAAYTMAHLDTFIRALAR
jgi:Ser/Thr protein kinase RdoA (MazF antagonist)